MNFNSIRSRTILIFIPLIIIPLLVGGIVGALYFQDVIRHNIGDDNLGQAKAISALTASYVELSENYLRSIADRPLLIKAVEERNQSFLNEMARYTAVQGLAFDSAIITDSSGTVIAYDTMYANRTNRTYPDIVGKNIIDRPYIGPVLNMSRPVVAATGNDIDGSSTIYVGVPIRNENNTTIGAIVGTYDMGNYTRMVIGTAARSSYYIYLVNRSGNVIVHSNSSYMSDMADFTSVPAVREVMQGKEGVTEQYNPIEKDDRLVAYSPVNNTGWGVVVAVPTSVAYQPVTNMLWAIGGITLALAAISLAFAYAFSKSITGPILGLFNAARAITNRREYKQYLPMKRKDEIGQVAVCMDSMARRINEDRDRITAERDRAEEERNRAGLYLDIMGHDINNLNQSTLTNLELIREEANLTGEEKESIEAAIASALSSAALITNVRKLQQISELTEPEIVDINDMILECIKEAPRPKDKMVIINYAPRKGIMSKCGHLIKEVFCNLIYNSIKHSGQEITIDIVAGDTIAGGRRFYTVTISDNGPGIADEVKPRLFGRFQRGETKARGKGLGLYIVKSILEKCDGSVSVEDRVPGDHTKGAKFTVLIPAAEA